MKEHLMHILDQSVCLSRRQLRDYLSGSMLPVEAHAVEVHLASCPLCSMAMEGFEEHSEEALQAIASLNSGFLKEHFDNIAPQIHLNSMAHAMAASATHAVSKKSWSIPVWRITGIAAAVLLAIGIFFWFVEKGRDSKGENRIVAMAGPPAQGPATVAAAPMNEEKLSAISKEPLKASSATVSSAPATAAGKPEGSLSQTTSKSSNNEELLPEMIATAPMATTKSNVYQPATEQRAMLKKDVLPAGAGEQQFAQNNNVAYNSSNVTSNSGGLTIAGGRTSGTKYVVDGIVQDREQNADKTEKEKATPAMAKRAAPKPGSAAAEAANDDQAKATTQTLLEKGNAAYVSGKYSQALRFFQRQMKIGDAGDRQKAAIMAARCYTALGNSVKAEELLQEAANGDNGRQRRAAKRELRRMK